MKSKEHVIADRASTVGPTCGGGAVAGDKIRTYGTRSKLSSLDCWWCSAPFILSKQANVALALGGRALTGLGLAATNIAARNISDGGVKSDVPWWRQSSTYFPALLGLILGPRAAKSSPRLMYAGAVAPGIATGTADKMFGPSGMKDGIPAVQSFARLLGELSAGDSAIDTLKDDLFDSAKTEATEFFDTTIAPTLAPTLDTFKDDLFDSAKTEATEFFDTTVAPTLKYVGKDMANQLLWGGGGSIAGGTLANLLARRMFKHPSVKGLNIKNPKDFDTYFRRKQVMERNRSILTALGSLIGGGLATGAYNKYTKSSSLTYADVIEAGKVVPKNISLKRRLSGRYPKGRVVWNGMAINIETPAGHWRMGKKSDGKLWLSKMNYAYGHIARRPGYDGSPIDVFLGPDLDSPLVFVINQSKMTDNRFDEHKVMIGWYTEAEARNAYKSHFKKVNAPYMGCVKMTIDQFKSWLPSAKKGPATKQADLSFMSPVLVGLAGVGSDMAANALARRNADRAAKILGVMTPEQKAYFDSQIKQPAVEVPGLKSPAYISQRDIENKLNVPVTTSGESRRGTVVYDPLTTPAAYYAHELAHKEVPRWAQYDRFTPKQLAIANVSSYLPGVIAGATTGKPVFGALTGAVSRLVGRSPVLLEEYLAMRRAKQLVDYMPGTEDEKNKQKTALTKAFLTYLLPPVASGAVSGGAAGLVRRY